VTGQKRIRKAMAMKIDTSTQTLQSVLENRLALLSSENKGNACQAQRHLDLGTPEREYWHHGYASALKDVLRILQGTPQSVN
jgi:hypothetical protein